jgi:hypothetical protein
MCKSVTESLWRRSAERFQRGVGLRHDVGAGPVGGLGYTVTEADTAVLGVGEVPMLATPRVLALAARRGPRPPASLTPTRGACSTAPPRSS